MFWCMGRGGKEEEETSGRAEGRAWKDEGFEQWAEQCFVMCIEKSSGGSDE